MTQEDEQEPVYVDWCSDCGAGIAEGDFHACQAPHLTDEEENEDD